MIHIYTGNGKGKTTAALGLALRATGSGLKVLWTSFLKDYDSGEFTIAPFKIEKGMEVKKFWFMMTEEEKAAVKAEHEERLSKLLDAEWDLLVLDEIFGSITVGAIDEAYALDLIRNHREKGEIVLTGRDPSEAFMAEADYISRIAPEKHPFDKGIPARKGIEY